MASFFRAVLVCAALAAVSFAQPASADAWKTAAALPGLDFSGLTPAQKTLALSILREQGCTCGCDMKMAECREKDPACAISRGLSNIVLRSAREGKTREQILKAVAASPLASHAAPPLLEDPISLSISGAPVTGPANARVTIVEFSDFECPYCRIAAPQALALQKDYRNDVKLVFKQFPLPNHPHARLAAQASVAAAAQGKFWPMHDKLFANARQLSRDNMLAWARELGLDMQRFTADLDSTHTKEVVARDVRDGDQANVMGTPTFFIDGKRYNGPFDVAAVKPLIDAELKQLSTHK